MRWIAKAGLQGVISALPRSEEINYVFQRKLTKRLPRGDSDFIAHAATAVTHVDAYRRQTGATDMSAVRAYEFGSGWDLIGAITLWALGVNDQTLIDIRRNVRLELINDTLARFYSQRESLEAGLGVSLRPIPARSVRRIRDLEASFGIRYLAPCDARATELSSGTFDLVTSTYTLEHISPADIASILLETSRLITAEGVMSSLIDLKDHYMYVDQDLSSYNFLKYSDRAWSLLNPGLQWQSRERYPRYIQLFHDAGFKILEDTHELPESDDIAALLGQRIHPRFRRSGWSLIDVGIKSMHLVACPAPMRGDVKGITDIDFRQ